MLSNFSLAQGNRQESETTKKQYILPSLILFLFIVCLGAKASASNTVRVFLLAGQSNMEGNNTTLSRLEELICLANSDFTSEGNNCDSTIIEPSMLEKRFIDTNKHLNDYYKAEKNYPDHPAVAKLKQFLCHTGKLVPNNKNYDTSNFDLTERLYIAISNYYYHTGNEQFQYGHDAFKQMSSAMGVAGINDDGFLTDDLLTEHPGVTVLQFQGQLSDNGKLSLNERKGNLEPNFGARVNTYGPELMFGHYMGKPMVDDILLLKVVQGGTDLRVDWKTPSSTKNKGNDFTPEELAQDSLYDALVAKAREIQNPSKLAEYFPQYAGKTAQISGFVWFQGWNDGLNPLNQSNYETNLKCMLNDLRADLDMPDLPVVIAQSHVGGADNPVQVAQAKVADAFDLCELITTNDLSGYYHFDPAAHLVIGERMAVAMKDLLGLGNKTPVANDQHFRMRAAELLALPITLAGTDKDGDDLNYTIVSEPSHGRLSGTAPYLEYLPESTFRGQDSFTYKADDSHSESNIATVTIDVIQEPYSDPVNKDFNRELYVHVPSHIVNADVSPYQHKVTLTGETRHESASSDPDLEGHVPWVSRNDLTNKTIEIILDNTSLTPPLTISFKLIPDKDNRKSHVIMQSNAFVMEERERTVSSTFYNAVDGESTVTNKNGKLNMHSGNHFAVTVGNGKHTIYLNGKPTEITTDTNNLRPLADKIVIGPYPGKVWDIRIYKCILSKTDILELGGFTCPDNPLVETPYEGYTNYLCGVYVCEWWHDDTTETLENYQYYLAAQDSVYERNLFEAGMYPRNNLSDYINNDPGRHLELSDGIRKTFVRPWSFDNPLKQKNGEYWLHENFHSFQGRLARYNGLGGNKFLLEATASWGANHNIPGVHDTLLAYYTLHPHLPLWTIQNSPVDMRAGYEFKGGHQYGAYIFWSYLTNYVTSKKLIGDIFNDRRAGSTPAKVAYELLAQQGHDMKTIFADFAARITTWDIRDGQHYAESEQASLRRMQRAKPDAETFDNKITAFYDSNGTGDRWTSVPEKYIPGSWAFNVFQVEISQDTDYVVALKTDISNPEYSDFQARVVVYNEQTEERVYYTLNVAEPGESARIKVPTSSDEKLYFIIATTPDIFKGWDWYQYKFKIYPVSKP